MQEFLSILKYLATSNTINFIIMVTLLAIIVKKMNLGASLEKSIEVVKATISKSDEEKSGAQKKLDSAKDLIEKLPQDIKNLEQTSKEKVEVFKDKIDENAQKAIFNIEKNIDKVVSIEEKKISNLLTEKTSLASIELAKQHIEKMLEQNPELHNKFIQNSIDELDKVKI